MTDREFWKARHRCVACHMMDAYTMSGRALCAECAEKDAATRRERYNADPEGWNKRDRDRYQKRKESHLCVKCGAPLEEGNGLVRCLRCARKQAAHDRVRTERRRAPEQNYPRGDNGICYICNRNPKLEGRSCCAACYPWLRDNMLAARAKQDLTTHSWHVWRREAGA